MSLSEPTTPNSSKVRSFGVAVKAKKLRFGCRPHPVTTPAALARIESALAVLRAAGFEGSDAAQGFAAVHTFTIGFAALEVSRSRTLVPGGGQAQVSRYWAPCPPTAS